MTGWVLLAGAALLVAGVVARAWTRSGPASSLRRGLWLLAPAGVGKAAGLVVGGQGPQAGLLGLLATLLVLGAILRATPSRGVRSTRGHLAEAVIAGLLVALVVAALPPSALAPGRVGFVLLAAEAAVLWLVFLGRREVRLQGAQLRWLVGGGAALAMAGRLGTAVADVGEHGLLVGAGLLLPALAWIAALAHPQARAPLAHVTRGAPRLAGHQIALVVAAALVGPGVALGDRLVGLPLDAPLPAVTPVVLTLLVVVHLVQLLQQRGQHVWEAQHDTLTGLPTEPLFEDRLRQAIASSRRSGSGLVVAFMDLDGFKEVNDTCGHEAGDEVLRRVAARLTGGLRAEDTVARRSGDEFLMLLTDTDDPSVAQAVVERLMECLSEPMEIDGESHEVGASVGLAAWPGDGLEVDELVQHADEAMYEAKEAGRGQVCWYRSIAATRTHLRVTLAHHLQIALRDGGQLELDHEPMVDLRDGTVDGFTCRARWRHPTLGCLTPSAFLPVAARSGLWRALDLEVLRLACVQARRWRADGMLDVPVRVRLCDDHASSEDLADDVLRILGMSALPPVALVLAVSERALSRGGETFMRTVDVLADHGVDVVVTGFGAADVGIFRLSHVRIAGLELSERIVSRATGVELPVVDTAIRLAHGLGLRVRADGVADDAQAEVLRSRGCVVARGPALGNALSSDALEARLRERVGRRGDHPRALLASDLAPVGTHDHEVSPVDGLLTSTLAGAGDVMESEVTDLLRRVGGISASLGPLTR